MYTGKGKEDENYMAKNEPFSQSKLPLHTMLLFWGDS